MIPDKIFRQTAEKSNELNLTHYELITKIMVDEYDYRIIEEGDTPFGTHYWNLVKNQTTNTNNGIYVTSSGAWTRATATSIAGSAITRARPDRAASRAGGAGTGRSPGRPSSLPPRGREVPRR